MQKMALSTIVAI